MGSSTVSKSLEINGERFFASRKTGNLVPLYFVFYNWMRIHKSLRVTPAMEAGLTDKLMTFEDLLALMDAAAPKTGRPRKFRNAT